MTVLRDYSQHGEQAAILEWADGRRGSFLDLGAYDGQAYSNTAALADLGWRGICVDASPDAISRCAYHYSDNPGVLVILAAFSIDDEHVATIHWTPRAMYSGLIANTRDDVNPIEINVATLDLAWLSHELQMMPQPVFASIDLEGVSVDALIWLKMLKTIKCVCVEANNPDDRTSVAAILDGWDLLAENDWNQVWART